jgi:hypothetical protein
MAARRVAHDIRDRVPEGHIIGRLGGDGAAEMISLDDLANHMAAIGANPSQKAGGVQNVPTPVAAIADKRLLANISGGTAVPVANTLTAILDNILGSAQGDIIYRNGTEWVVLAPGTSGKFLKTLGAAANPLWDTPATGSSTLAGDTDVSITSPADNHVLRYKNADAKWENETLTALLDGVFSSTQGSILYRGASAWAALGPGAQYTVLESQGAAANPAYATITALLDAVFSSVQGSVLYRGAGAWAALGPGTNGQALVTAGAAANPVWGSIGGGSGGGLTQIGATQVASTSASLDFTGLSGTSFVLVGRLLVPATNSDSLILQFGHGAGPTYLTSSYDTQKHLTGENSFAADSGSGAASGIALSTTQVPNTSSGLGASFTIWIETDNAGFVGGHGTSRNKNTDTHFYTSLIGGGVALPSAALSAMRLKFLSGGNISTGNATLYRLST